MIFVSKNIYEIINISFVALSEIFKSTSSSNAELNWVQNINQKLHNMLYKIFRLPRQVENNVTTHVSKSTF